MIGAGLLAKKAVEQGLSHQALGQDEPGPGLARGHRVPQGRRTAALPRAARLPGRRLRLHHLHRQQRPAARADRARPSTSTPWWPPRCSPATGTSRRGSTRWCAPTTSPRRCSWWPSRWPAGWTSTSISEPLGTGKDGKPVFLQRHLAHRAEEIARHDGGLAQARAVPASSTPRCSRATRCGRHLPVPDGSRYAWDPKSTYVQEPPFFQNLPAEPGAAHGHHAAPGCSPSLGDSVTTDHISPAGAIPKNGPAAPLPAWSTACEQADWNTFGARRGNHEVMMRGTFGNVRIKNAPDARQGRQLDRCTSRAAR